MRSPLRCAAFALALLPASPCTLAAHGISTEYLLPPGPRSLAGHDPSVESGRGAATHRRLSVQRFGVPSPMRRPARAAKRITAKPAPVPPLPDRKPSPPPLHPRNAAAAAWTPAAIAQAQATCQRLLGNLNVSYSAREPIREGRCGAPYPVLVNALGAEPSVRIDPPAILTCAMAADLSRWLDETVQPAARQLLKAPIVRLRNAASYVCRNRYDDPEARLSEHARANAIDIAAFITEDGQTVTLSDYWQTESEQQVAAGADAEAEVTAHASAPQPPASLSENPADPRSKFLQELHVGACRVFGTVLGPDANQDHLDHFHLDAAKRTRGAYCR